MVFKNLVRKCHVGLVAFCIVSAAVVANCQTVSYEDGFATGIQNLRVGVLCYDVNFKKGSYLQVFGDHSPEFLNRPVAANMVANEIMNVLNAQPSIPEINASDVEVIWVPNERVSRNRFRAEQVGHNESTDPWQRYLDFEGQANIDWEAYDFAVFKAGPHVVYADNSGQATGINNLYVDGTCVDVRFARGSYQDVYGAASPRYLGLEPAANAAADAIMAVLNAEPTVPEINDSPNEVLWIPTDRSRLTFQAEQVGHNQSWLPWQRFGDFQGSVAADFDAWDFAVFGESLDCNRDGVVDVNDMNCACGTGLGDSILDAINSLAGDLDGDGSVGFGDFLELSQNFGEAGEYTDGDLNCDGIVDFGDYLILSGNFGESGGMNWLPPIQLATIPEPAGHVLMMYLAILSLAVIRRRKCGNSGSLQLMHGGN